MASIVCMARESTHLAGARRQYAYQVGDPVQVFEDGSELGRDVEPATAPDDTPFVVLEVPGPKSDYLYLMMAHRGPMFLQTDPSKGEFGFELQDELAKRKYQIDLSRLPGRVRAEWTATRSQGPSKRRTSVAISTRSAFEFAVRDKATGDPIDSATIPRGRKQ